MVRKGSLLILLLVSTTMTFAEKGLMNNNGMFVSTGGGLAPIYIEEVVTQDALTAGATVMAAHTNLKLGSVFNNNYAAYLLADHNVYRDSLGNTYITGVAGIGVTYFVPEFYNFYFSAGAGIANKLILGAALSSSGTGLYLNAGLPLTNNLTIDVGYQYLSLSSVASTVASGEEESISSINFGLTYLWF